MMVGKKVAHYQIEKKIGQGGMGEVYLAQDTSLDRQVALKFLPEPLQRDPTARRRFLREARSAAALDHPFICHIHQVGEDGGRSFIAMEYVEGETLKKRLDEGPFELGAAIPVISEIAEALDKAHCRNIVHRDLKPSNIMLTLEGHVKVMDFGLSKPLPGKGAVSHDATAVDLTHSGMAVGTVPYMSPEQLRGDSVDTRSDIFALGILIYEMLTGVHPFARVGSSATANAILTDAPSPLSAHLSGVPKSLEAMVNSMLAKRPGQRPASVRDISGTFSGFQLTIGGDGSQEGLLEGFLGRLVSPSPRRWWELNLLATTLVFYPANGVFAWAARGWLEESGRSQWPLVLLVGVSLFSTASLIFRGYLLITSAFNSGSLAGEVERWGKMARFTGFLAFVVLTCMAAMAIQIHAAYATLLLAYSVGAFIATLVAEPVIERSAFAEPFDSGRQP